MYIRVSPSEERSTSSKVLSKELVIELLCQSARHTIGLQSWSKDVKLTGLGATSFDIVRLSTHFLEAFSRHSSSDCIQEIGLSLFDMLLTSTIEQVAIQLLTSIEDGDKEICQKTRKRSVLNEAPDTHKQTRIDVLALQDAVLGGVTLSWRAGKIFKNGQ